MRVTKDANERKNEILDAAEILFNNKGFDATTISDIIQKVGIARGTIYYHFQSKEDILDALIVRRGEELLNAAQRIASDKSIPVAQRLFLTLMEMNGEKDNKSEIIRQMHKPQNALMHQKSHEAMLEGVPQILVDIIEEGIEQGLFDTPYPYESLEMIVAYVNIVFNDYAEKLKPEELMRRVKAFIFILERLFGAKEGCFAWVMELFLKGDIHEYDKK